MCFVVYCSLRTPYHIDTMGYIWTDLENSLFFYDLCGICCWCGNLKTDFCFCTRNTISTLQWQKEKKSIQHSFLSPYYNLGVTKGLRVKSNFLELTDLDLNMILILNAFLWGYYCLKWNLATSAGSCDTCVIPELQLSHTTRLLPLSHTLWSVPFHSLGWGSPLTKH